MEIKKQALKPAFLMPDEKYHSEHFGWIYNSRAIFLYEKKCRIVAFYINSELLIT